MASRVAELVIKVTADATQATSELSKASTSGGKLRKGLAVASKASAVALGLVGAAAISAGKAAAEDAQSQAVLAQQMRNSAGASDAQIASMEDYIAKASAATGVADDQLRPAMANLVRATGDASKAQKDMNTVLDVAAATGASVETVSKAVAKGYGGSTGSLKKLVPTLDEATLKSGDMNAIMAEMAKTTSGAAAASANTAAGKMQRMSVAIGETQEAIGALLLPVLDKLSTVLLDVANAAQAHPKVFAAVAIAVAALAAAILILNTAVTIYTAVTTLAGSATLAAWAAALWPILLVLAAIGLVVAVVVLLWKKSKTFRDITLAVWAAIKKAAMGVWRFLKGAFSVIWTVLGLYVKLYVGIAKLAFTAIKLAIGFVIDKVKSLITKVKGITVPAAIKTAFNAVKTVVGDVIEKIKTLVTKIGDISLPGTIKSAFEAVKGVVDDIIDAVQSLIGWIGKIKIPSAVGKLLGKANPFSAPAPATVAARGPAPVGFRASRLGATTRQASTGVTINVTGALDPEAVARQIRRILDGHDRRVGLRPA